METQNQAQAQYAGRRIRIPSQGIDSQKAMSGKSGQPINLVQTITSQKLDFDFQAFDVVRMLIQERLVLRDRNRRQLLEMISETTGKISCCRVPYCLDPQLERKAEQLESLRMNLERQLLMEDVSLWKDTTSLRQIVIDAERQYQSTALRTSLVAGNHDHGTNQEDQDTMGAGNMPGTQADSW